MGYHKKRRPRPAKPPQTQEEAAARRAAKAAASRARRAANPAPPAQQRRNELPEHTDYRDTGCSLAPACLTCPFSRCVHDARGATPRLLAELRDQRIAEARANGELVATIAATHGLSPRHVKRILAQHGAA